MTKMRQDNDVIDRIGPVHVENETKLSGPIRQGAVYDVK